MNELTVNEIWNALVLGEYFTDEELTLLTKINGYSIDTLNDAIYVRYGYRNYQQLYSDDEIGESFWHYLFSKRE